MRIENEIICGDALTELGKLPDGCVDTCVTSPPYWGLRDYGVEGQLGLETTPDEYVAKMVAIFREVKRVLKPEGTLFLNLGDSYYSSGGAHKNDVNPGISKSYFRGGVPRANACGTHQTLKPKDLVGIPWRVAFALQADGWWLRQDIIWHKPNPMPESVTDRCTKAHEYVFMLSKSARYYFDGAAIAEPSAGNPAPTWEERKAMGEGNRRGFAQNAPSGCHRVGGGATRNKRDVWTIATHPYPEAHFATFPPELPRLCILAGTSERGACPECGAPRRRIVERKSGMEGAHGGLRKRADAPGAEVSETSVFRTGTIAETTTTGWEPTCECGREDTEPCLVLDPFMGAGTTGLVAKRLGRDYLGIELNPEYAAMAERRIKGDMPLFAEAEA